MTLTGEPGSCSFGKAPSRRGPRTAAGGCAEQTEMAEDNGAPLQSERHFGQGARLILVEAFVHGQASGEDLRGDDVWDGREDLLDAAREADDPGGEPIHFVVARVGDGV